MSLNVVFAVIGLIALIGFVLAAVMGRTGVGEDTAERVKKFFTSWKFFVPLVLIGVCVVLYFVAQASSLEAPSTGTVWAFTKKYWWWFLIPIGLAYFLLSVIPKDKEGVERAGKVQKVLVALTLMLFVGIPLVHLAWGEKTSSPQTEQTCSPYSSTDVGECTVTEDGVLSSPGESVPENEFELCYVKKPADAPLETKWVGVKIQFKSVKGSFSVRYQLIKRTNLVNGKCPDKL